MAVPGGSSASTDAPGEVFAVLFARSGRACSLAVPFGACVGTLGALLGAVTRLFVDSVLGWYQRDLRTSTREFAQAT